MYYVIEEASESLELISSDLQDCINYSISRKGKYLVLNEEDNILFDSQPNITYKI